MTDLSCFRLGLHGNRTKIHRWHKGVDHAGIEEGDDVSIGRNMSYVAETFQHEGHAFIRARNRLSLESTRDILISERTVGSDRVGEFVRGSVFTGAGPGDRSDPRCQ